MPLESQIEELIAAMESCLNALERKGALIAAAHLEAAIVSASVELQQ